MRKLVLIIAVLIAAAPSVFAGAIGTYTFTGLASGTIGSASFSNATLTVTASGPISAVTGSGSTPYFLLIPAGSASFTIGGIGSGTFSDVTDVFDTNSLGLAGFGDQGATHCCDIIDIVGPSAFFSYDLQSSIGPLGPVPSDGAILDWFNLNTSLGAFTLTQFDNITFQASVTGVSATPEPGTLLLLASGLTGIGFLRRKFAGLGN